MVLNGDGDGEQNDDDDEQRVVDSTRAGRRCRRVLSNSAHLLSKSPDDSQPSLRSVALRDI